MHTNPSRRGFIKQVAAVGAASAMASPWEAGAAPGADAKVRQRFAICNETFGDWPFEKAFALAAECGYEGIEVAPFTVANDVTDISATRRSEIRRQASAAGVEIIGLHWLLARTQGLHLTSPDRTVRRKTAAYLGALAQFCADLGGKLLVFGSPQQRNLADGIRYEKALDYAAEVFRETLPALEKTNVRIALEPLSPGTTNFVRTAAEAVDVIRKVDSPRFRLILDCLAMSSEPTPIPDLIRRNREWLVHLHANDPNRKGPGFGELDFVPIFRALRDVNFKGWASVEVFDYTPGPERLARESIAYMKQCRAKLRS